MKKPASPASSRPACPPTPTPSSRPDRADPVTPPPEPHQEQETGSTGRAGEDRTPIDAGAAPAPAAPLGASPPPAPSLTARLAAHAASLLRRAVTSILRAGPIPAHVAFIMDGNRRFAERRGDAVVAGHEAGYQKV